MIGKIPTSGQAHDEWNRPYPRAQKKGLGFRLVQKADLTFLNALYASTRAEEVAQVVGWSDAQKHTFLSQQFTAQHVHYLEYYPEAVRLIIIAENNPAGRLYLADWKTELRIIDIALLPEMRNRGFGSAILSDILARAEQTAKPVSIHVETNNPARNLYFRNGFEIVKNKGVYDLMEWRKIRQGTVTND